MDTEDNKEINTIFGSVEYTKTVPNKDNVEIHANWTIPKFMELINNKKIDSPTLTETSPIECKFQFTIIPYKPENKIEIYYMPSTQVFLKSVQLKTFTFDKNNWAYDREQCIIGLHEHRIVKTGTWCHIKRLSIMGSYLQDGDKICFLKNGSLHLKFELVMTVEIETKGQFQIPVAQLSNDLENLFLEGMYTDIAMKSAENKEFRAHKAMLASRSVVLKAHFGHKTTESITNIVESPLESEVLHEVLLFIYTDKSPKLDEIPEKLLAASDYYQLSRLKSLCEEALYKKLTVDNAIETLQLADLHSANTLKDLTLKFIRRDDKQLAMITKTPGWGKLQSVDLSKMICEYSNTLGEDYILTE